jgi:hypothetical protein
MKLYIIGSDLKLINLLELTGAVGIKVDEDATMKSVITKVRNHKNSIGGLIVESRLLSKYPKLAGLLVEEEIAWTQIPSESTEVESGTQNLELLAEKTLGMKINVT